MPNSHLSSEPRLPSHRPSKRMVVLILLGIVVYTGLLYFILVGPSSFRWKAIFGDPIYPENYNIHGIDISHHQAEVDWEVVANEAEVNGDPITFVIIKATEGSNRFDSLFNENFYHAKSQGLICGAYHFWSNHTSAKQQAVFFMDNVHLQEGDLPPVLDVEQYDEQLTKQEFCQNVLTWLKIVEDHFGATPIIYTGLKFKKKYLDGKEFDHFPYWIAHYYTKDLGYDGEWKFWQHTDVGHLKGVKGYVDLNVYNGSYYDLQQLTLRMTD